MTIIPVERWCVSTLSFAGLHQIPTREGSFSFFRGFIGVSIKLGFAAYSMASAGVSFGQQFKSG
jgi:hypothetical protein